MKLAKRPGTPQRHVLPKQAVGIDFRKMLGGILEISIRCNLAGQQGKNSLIFEVGHRDTLLVGSAVLAEKLMQQDENEELPGDSRKNVPGGTWPLSACGTFLRLSPGNS